MSVTENNKFTGEERTFMEGNRKRCEENKFTGKYNWLRKGMIAPFKTTRIITGNTRG